jgi:hypothetical protein
VVPAAPSKAAPAAFASLKVRSQNLGDHIQVLGGLDLLGRLGVAPDAWVDRDDELASTPSLQGIEGQVGLLLNGWFKSGAQEWPPGPRLSALPYGLHLRPWRSEALLSDGSIEWFKAHQPVGCRDTYTTGELRVRGVDAFTSRCASLAFPRRLERPHLQTETFVVSRDQRICERLPPSLGGYTFVNQYVEGEDFEANMSSARALLADYRARAGLIVTTLLHCALPAIAMGVPVVVLLPLNQGWQSQSDRERFSALDDLAPVHDPDDLDQVDWRPAPVDASGARLDLLTGFFEQARRWSLPPAPPIGPIVVSGDLR